MKRICSVILIVLLSLGVQAEDAFHGILPVTDATMKRSLNGTWRLKVVKSIDGMEKVPQVDNTWGSIPVPGCWEVYGFCEPRYNRADSLTGYYHTEFSVPSQWSGQRIALRLDGVLYAYDLWVNGNKVGSWHSAYNTAVFDITPYVKWGEGRQQLDMRVVSRHKTSDFDCNDDWAPSGIFRDVTLMAVPETHLSNVTITTRNTGEVKVKTIVEGDKNAVASYEILDQSGRIVAKGKGQDATMKVKKPMLWTAETPSLYTMRITLRQRGKTLQTYTERFGFRELTIDGNVLKLNGQPIKLRGVTCHSTDPRTVKVVSEDLTLLDMKLMKEASVNYIRTSHYPREPRFYELADSLGFYVISEVPFGYGDKLLSDNATYPELEERARATIRRDKNHPSILIWSIGNENPLTDICVKVGDYVKAELDPSRPYCYPQVGSYFRKFFEGKEAKGFPSKAPIYSPHYPTTGQIGGFYQGLDRPVIFTEYCHTLGTSFEDHDRQWEIIERTPGIAGGSVWEWVDQGMPFSLHERREMMDEDLTGNKPLSPLNPHPSFMKYGYEERVFTSENGGFEMYGDKGTDGLLYADRTPLPNYYELRRNYARAFAEFDGETATLTLHNRFDFLNLKDNVFFHWTMTNNLDTVASGTFSPDCTPHSTAKQSLTLPEAKGLSLLTVNISDKEGHTFLNQSFVLRKEKVVPLYDHGAPFVNAADLIVSGDTLRPYVRTGRKPTLAEKIKQADRLPKHYLLATDGMKQTTLPDSTRCAIKRKASRVSFALQTDTANVFHAELGLAYLLPKMIDRVTWIGQGKMPSYPGRYKANIYGAWSLHKDDLYFEGNHSGIDAALLTDAEGNGLLIEGDSLSLNFEQTDRGVVVTVNAAVAGQGPKFARTAFSTVNGKEYKATFNAYVITPENMPEIFRRCNVSKITPFQPFVKQYDTYLMKLEDISNVEL